MKKILIIAQFPPPVHGSAVMSQYIKDSKIINEAFDCEYLNLSTSRKMEEIGKWTFLKNWRLLDALLKLLIKLSTRHYDLCYITLTCHGGPFLKDVPFVLLCKLFGKKLVIHQHNKGMSNDVERWPYKWLFPLAYKNVTVILLSWYLYHDIEKIVPRENVIICPNGIPAVDYVFKERSNSIPQMLFLSNLIESKGVLVLLNALKILMEKGYSFLCNFVGGETAEIDRIRFEKEVAERGLTNFVRYNGKKYGYEKELMFEKADIFVFPTFYENETFGLVNLEAMAHHLPIISTNEGGIPDVVVDGENGLICEKNNPESLAHCISILLSDKNLREKMGVDGYNKLHQKFTIKNFEENLMSVFNIVLNR